MERTHEGKWSEAIGRAGIVVKATAIKPHELADWIERRLRGKGLRVERDAVQRLAERVEGNLLAAAQEIDKLVLLADGGILDAARMDALVADAARFDVFRLVDAAMNGNGAQVSRMFRGLQAEGEAIPALMGMVVKELQTAAALARGAQFLCRVQGAAHLAGQGGRVQARAVAASAAALAAAAGGSRWGGPYFQGPGAAGP